MWQVRTNNVMHIAASSSTGLGLIVENGGGYIVNTIKLNHNEKPYVVYPLDSSKVRTKFLNAYHPFDLELLTTPPNKEYCKEDEKYVDHESDEL
jgi:hypothetical protein